MSDKIKTAITILSITVIAACLIQAIPKYKQLQKYNELMQEYGITESNDTKDDEISTSDEVDSMHSSVSESITSETEVDYRTTQEYEDINNRILAVQERIRLLDNNLINDLTDITKVVFNQITNISGKPDDEKLVSQCKQYMTDDFYEQFEKMTFEHGSYIVYDIQFSDLDKNDITAYVLTRSADQYSFFVTYSFDKEKNYVISDIKQIT